MYYIVIILFDIKDLLILFFFLENSDRFTIVNTKLGTKKYRLRRKP